MRSPSLASPASPTPRRSLAAYPGLLILLVLSATVVLLADTIGNLTDGGNPRALNGAYKCYSVTMPADVDAGDYTLNAKVEDAATGDTFRAVIFASDNSTVVAYSTERTNISTVGLQPFSGDTFASVGLSNGTTYRLCVGSNSAAGANAYYDDDGDPPDNDNNGYTGIVNSLTAEPPTITGSLSNDALRPYVIHLDYTPSAGGGSGDAPANRLLLRFP